MKICFRNLGSVLSPFAAFILIALSSGCLPKSAEEASQTSGSVQPAGEYSITHFDPVSMPPECNPPPGFDRNDGVAIIEGDPMINGAICSGFASPGIPDCTKILKEKKLCGLTYTITANGVSKEAYLTGVCPWDHATNAAKGQWNPCGKHRKNHLDIMDGLYTKLGLNNNQSWGPNGNTGEVNPQAVYVQIKKSKHYSNVSPVHP